MNELRLCHTGKFLFLLGLCAPAIAGCASDTGATPRDFAELGEQLVVAASIAGSTASGVGYVSTTGASTIDATIGRWDTPYPNPGSGAPAPGLEPLGNSTLTIDVDVNNGGLVTFRYQLLTYDAGIYDWLDISMVTPTATIPIVQNLGKPGNAYGTYWQSSNIAVSQSLDQWRNQRVSFVFTVVQDGWGDQTAAILRSFSVTTCHVPPLTTLADPVAIDFENGNTIDTAHLNAETSAGLTCMQQAVQAAGGTMILSSAYRPSEYQAHLREVWDGWTALRNDTLAECATQKQLYGAEFQRHQLLLGQRPASPSGQHTQGNAFDATISGLPTGQTQDTIAAGCGMWRRIPVTDPVHYEPQ